MGIPSRSNYVAEARFGGRRYNNHENRRPYNKRAQTREYVEEYQHTQCAQQEYPALQYYYDYNSAPQYPAYEEGNHHSTSHCCSECSQVQAMQDWRKSSRYSASGRRDAKERIERQPGQSLPGTVSPPAFFCHTPYSVVEQIDSSVAAAATELYKNFKAPSSDPLCYDMPPCFAPSTEHLPVTCSTHEENVYPQPKERILCLRWCNGTCGERKKNASAEELQDAVVCPYAHPDLSEVPPGVCPTYWFTGFCRFDRRDQSQVEPEDESLEFGLHGWNHYKRMESNVSDDSSNDGDKKKPSNSRRRPPSVCYSCHHAQPVGGFPLLPGISCKTTVLEREAALARYPTWY